MTAPKTSRTTIDSRTGSMRLDKLGVSRFSLTDPYHFALTLSWFEFFAVLVVAYVAINFAFGLLYFAVPGSIANLPAGSLVEAFFFSVETLATVGYGAMAPSTLYGHVVATIEIFIGMLFTATMTGLVFVRFSRPKAKILFAERIVVTTHDGRPMLMIRIGNGRANSLSDATARLTVLLVERSADGRMFRRALDLKLVRSDFPFFPLTWTLMHELGPASPLVGLGAEDPRVGELRFMLRISALDPSLGAHVQDARSYKGDDLAFGMRYVDAVTWDGHDHSIADMRKISLIEPDADEPAPQRAGAATN